MDFGMRSTNHTGVTYHYLARIRKIFKQTALFAFFWSFYDDGTCVVSLLALTGAVYKQEGKIIMILSAPT